jgi:hypothetical protein
MSKLKRLILIIIVVLFLAVGYRYYQIWFVEPIEYDHLPELLSNQVSLKEISEEEYLRSTSDSEQNCLLEEKMSILEGLGYEGSIPTPPVLAGEDFCQKYDLESGNNIYIIWLQKLHPYILINAAPNKYEVVIEPNPNMPENASSLYDIKGTENGIVFRYAGFHNPLKFLKLSFTN